MNSATHGNAGAGLSRRFGRALRGALGLGALVALSAAPAQGQSFFYQLYSWSQDRPGEVPGDEITEVHHYCESSGAGLSGSCGVSGLTVQTGGQLQNGTMSSYASLLADGALLSSAGFPETAVEYGYGVEATTWINDQIVFTGLVPSSLRFSWTLQGLLANTRDENGGSTGLGAGGWTYVTASQGGPATEGMSGESLRTAGGDPNQYRSINTSGMFEMALLSSDPVFMDWYVGNDIGVIAPGFNQPLHGFTEGQVSAARLTVQALDAQGNDITALAGMQFQSGNTYGTTVTPEPVSMALLGTGLAGLGALRRRRRKQDEPA